MSVISEAPIAVKKLMSFIGELSKRLLVSFFFVIARLSHHAGIINVLEIFHKFIILFYLP
jgi:hypothetical protein